MLKYFTIAVAFCIHVASCQRTPLMEAAINGNVEQINKLVNDGTLQDVNAVNRDEFDFTPLLYASLRKCDGL